MWHGGSAVLSSPGGRVVFCFRLELLGQAFCTGISATSLQEWVGEAVPQPAADRSEAWVEQGSLTEFMDGEEEGSQPWGE